MTGDFGVTGLLVVGLVVPMVMMCLVWLLARSMNNAGIVDVFWSYGFLPVALLYALLGSGDPVRRWMLAAMVGLWSLRLGTYLAVRVFGHHPEEDGRYAALRAQFPKHTWAMFFGFFQLQAVLITVLSLPFALAAANPAQPAPAWWEWTALVLWLAALLGESLADAQLSRFRADPANRGRTCRSGLWRYSRHPNYFCEWLVWVAYAVYALGSPGGWLGVISPLLMYFFLTRVTGIKATEEQALRSRGADYADYQRRTSAFFPRPPLRD